MANSSWFSKNLAKAGSLGWVSRALGRAKPEIATVETKSQLPPRVSASHGELLWFHADGPDELADLQDLIARLGEQKMPPMILLTSRVLASGLSASRDYPDLVSLSQCPTEEMSEITRFLDQWQPRLCLWLGGSYAPNLISATVARGIPMINANTVLTTKERFRNRGALRSLRVTVDKFDRVFARDAASRAKLIALGLSEEKLPVGGPLVTGHKSPAFNEQLHAKMGKAIGSRPVWLACRILASELDAVLEAQRDAARLTHRLLLVLQPASPADTARFATALKAADIGFVRRSLGEEPRYATSVILDDTLDELGLWLRIAPQTFLGQSLTHGGGTDPLDAAALGSAIIHGPFVAQFEDSYTQLADVGATVCVKTAKSLTEAVCEISFPDVAAQMAHAAWQVESRGADVVESIEMEIFALINRDTVAA